MLHANMPRTFVNLVPVVGKSYSEGTTIGSLGFGHAFVYYSRQLYPLSDCQRKSKPLIEGDPCGMRMNESALGIRNQR